MLGWLRKAKDVVSPQPDLDAVPNMANHGVGMEYLIAGLGENKEVPCVGDVVIKLTSCSMGMTISRDTRYRVDERLCTRSDGKMSTTPNAVRGTTQDGDSDVLHVFYMRPANGYPRTWILMD